MIEYNEKNIKTWSLVGSRATFGLVSLELAKKEKELRAQNKQNRNEKPWKNKRKPEGITKGLKFKFIHFF